MMEIVRLDDGRTAIVLDSFDVARIKDLESLSCAIKENRTGRTMEEKMKGFQAKTIKSVLELKEQFLNKEFTTTNIKVRKIFFKNEIFDTSHVMKRLVEREILVAEKKDNKKIKTYRFKS